MKAFNEPLMPIVGAALLPHSPLLLPGLTPEARALVAKSASAIAAVATSLQHLEPDVLLVMVCHTNQHDSVNRYALLQGSNLPYAFNELGDLSTTGSFKTAVGFTHHLKEQLETSFPVPLVSTTPLPYGLSVPLVALGAPLNTKPIVCLQLPQNIPLDELNSLGELVKESLASTKERVVVIAAGDLAHVNQKTSTEAKIFDQLFQTACQESSLEKLVNLDLGIRQLTHECLQAPATFLYRLLQGHKLGTTLRSYEAPAGVGLLVAEISLD